MTKAIGIAPLLATGVLLTVLLNASHFATAQENCEAIPAGPDRTDCYIVRSRIYRQKSELSATIARQQADAATYRQVTGKPPKKKVQRTAPLRR
jgi:hypothetical protein